MKKTARQSLFDPLVVGLQGYKGETGTESGPVVGPPTPVDSWPPMDQGIGDTMMG